MQTQKPRETIVHERELPHGSRYAVELAGNGSTKVFRVYPISVSEAARKEILKGNSKSYKANGFDVHLMIGDYLQENTEADVSGKDVTVFLSDEDQHPSKTVEVDVGTTRLEIEYQG